MAKRSAAKGGASKKGVSKSTARPAKKPSRGPLTEKAANTLKVLKDNAQAVGVEPGKDWPADTVPNVRAWQKLPDGWRHAFKVTNASAKSSGGTLHRCYVGPGGVIKWHKKDLEEYLGKEFPKDGGERPRFMSALVCKDFPPKEIIRRTAKKDSSPYVLKRCDDLAGKTVEYALMQFTYKKNGADLPYGLSDLKYDIRSGNLELGKAAGAAAAKAGAKRAALGKTGKTAAGAPAGKARKVAAGVAAGRAAASAKGAATSQRAAPAAARAAPAARAQGDEAAGAKAAAASALQGAKRKSATPGQLFTLNSAAAVLRIEKSLALSLQNIVKMPPSERGAFGRTVIKEFERLLR
ncbi:unnamed protein product [Prorocentrum cordatum]|uniref:MBD domain-containing protein n=1 Tax=Prorocentrum cordatum TaxID=2364126 RepID=A0ABN9V0Y0_9DINO|nr:unnamed protein product [Polarella glacialis]